MLPRHIVANQLKIFTPVGIAINMVEYIKNNSPSEGIVLENKTNLEKHTTHEFKPSEIFRCSDLMVDLLVSLLERERKQKAS